MTQINASPTISKMMPIDNRDESEVIDTSDVVVYVKFEVKELKEGEFDDVSVINVTVVVGAPAVVCIASKVVIVVSLLLFVVDICDEVAARVVAGDDVQQSPDDKPLPFLQFQPGSSLCLDLSPTTSQCHSGFQGASSLSPLSRRKAHIFTSIPHVFRSSVPIWAVLACYGRSRRVGLCPGSKPRGFGARGSLKPCLSRKKCRNPG